jgi:hypothetical protein
MAEGLSQHAALPDNSSRFIVPFRGPGPILPELDLLVFGWIEIAVTDQRDFRARCFSVGAHCTLQRGLTENVR